VERINSWPPFKHALNYEDLLFCRWEAARDLAAVRCTDDIAPQASMPITDISACGVAGDISVSGVPLNVTAGWLDSTAAPAIYIFCNAAKAPGMLAHIQ